MYDLIYYSDTHNYWWGND